MKTLEELKKLWDEFGDISGDSWLGIELREYQKMIADPFHEEKKSNYYYMRRAKYLKNRIETAINNGEIVYEKV